MAGSRTYESVVAGFAPAAATIQKQFDGAALCGDLARVRALHEQGAYIRHDRDYALRWAAAGGHLAVVEYLHRKGVDITPDNVSALHWAAGGAFAGGGISAPQRRQYQGER